MFNAMRVLCFVFLTSLASYAISAVPMVPPNNESAIEYSGALQRIDVASRLVTVSGVTYHMDANFDVVSNESGRLFALESNSVVPGSKVGVELYKGKIVRLHVFE